MIFIFSFVMIVSYFTYIYIVVKFTRWNTSFDCCVNQCKVQLIKSKNDKVFHGDIFICIHTYFFAARIL